MLLLKRRAINVLYEVQHFHRRLHEIAKKEKRKENKRKKKEKKKEKKNKCMILNQL